jgi:hypothetical protein
VIRLFRMVNAAIGLDRMPQVIDGAFDLFYELFSQNSASTPVRRSGSPSCRTAFRSRSTASSSSTHDQRT